MNLKTNSLISKMHWMLSKSIHVVLFLAVLMLCKVNSHAQEIKAPVTTQDIQSKLEKQVISNEKKLSAALSDADTAEAASLEVISDRAGPPVTRGVRDITPTRDTEIPTVGLTLKPDATMKVKDANNTFGLILTGKWITDYAKMIKIIPEYEKTLAVYRSQADVHKQLMAELEGVIDVKDKKIGVLAEMNKAQKERGDLYKTMAEINETPWFQKVLNKLAFPAGLALGTYVGVKIANNN